MAKITQNIKICFCSNFLSKVPKILLKLSLLERAIFIFWSPTLSLSKVIEKYLLSKWDLKLYLDKVVRAIFYVKTTIWIMCFWCCFHNNLSRSINFYIWKDQIYLFPQDLTFTDVNVLSNQSFLTLCLF